MTSSAARGAACACALALAIVAGTQRSAAAGDPARTNPWTIPHVLRISDAGALDTLNPHLSQNAPVANLSELTMAWLVRWDEHNVPYPELATEIPSVANGGVSKDGLTITYHLRRGVTWSDGAPFTADDVVFSTNVVDNPANDEAARFDQLASVEEPDRYTVVYHLKKPYSTFVEGFFSSCCANPSLLPKHLLARYSSINDVPYNALPVGIGPFKFARWDRSKDVVLVANPSYWRGRPKLDEIVYEIVPNRNDLLARLADHQVDMWYQFGGAYLDRIRAISGYGLLRKPSYAYDHLDFNLTHAVVADPVVRKALRLALDRRAIVENLKHGVGIVQDSALPVSAPYYTELGTTPYDVAAANRLLDEAGWRRSADGIREKNGVRLDLDVAVASGQPDTDAELDLIRSNWNRAGAGVHVSHYPAPRMFAPQKEGGIIYGQNWDVVVFAWAADPLGDFSNLYGCDAFPPAGQNDVRWCNPTAQRAFQAFFSHYRESERNADVATAMGAFVGDAPSLVLDLREDLFAYNRDLKNYRPNNVTPFDNIMDVDI